MCNTLQVRWTIIPQTSSSALDRMRRMGGMRAFQSSGKIRLNANGRKLDAWLIYKCIACEKAWNRPIFERQNVRDNDPDIHEALQSNDPEWIGLRHSTFKRCGARRKGLMSLMITSSKKATLHEVTNWTKLRDRTCSHESKQHTPRSFAGVGVEDLALATSDAERERFSSGNL